MAESQTAVIERLLLDLVRSFEQKPGHPWCAELCAEAGGKEAWVQVTAGEINFGYPFGDEPIQKLKSLIIPVWPRMRCIGWKPQQYATLELLVTVDVQWLSRFIDRLFIALYGCGETYQLQTEITEL